MSADAVTREEFAEIVKLLKGIAEIKRLKEERR
jgi:hypothetical protein